MLAYRLPQLKRLMNSNPDSNPDSNPSETPGVDDSTRAKASCPSRRDIRELVHSHQHEMRRIAGRGGNAHQLILDHQDKLEAFAKSLSPDAGIDFFRIYTEETNAITQHLIEETDRLNAAAESDYKRAVIDGSPQPAPDWRDQSLGEQLIRGLIGGAVAIAVIGYCFK